VLADRPDAAGGAIFVFSPVMKGDSRAAAAARAEELADPRAVFLWDPDRRVGRALAGTLGMGRDGFAWDVYCLYAAGATWDESLPAPARWVHQLQGADPAHAAMGRVREALAEGLEAIQAEAPKPKATAELPRVVYYVISEA
jgi:hypothetical protein